MKKGIETTRIIDLPIGMYLIGRERVLVSQCHALRSHLERLKHELEAVRKADGQAR